MRGWVSREGLPVWQWIQAGEPERAPHSSQMKGTFNGCDESRQRESREIGNKEQACKDSFTGFIRKGLIFWRPAQQIATYSITFLSADLPLLLGATSPFWKFSCRRGRSDLFWKLPFETQPPRLRISLRAGVLFSFFNGEDFKLNTIIISVGTDTGRIRGSKNPVKSLRRGLRLTDGPQQS